MEQVTTMRGVDIEENTRDDNGLLLEEFFKERLAHTRTQENGQYIG